MVGNTAVEKSPEGYAQVGCYLGSDDSFMLNRRFGYLHLRLLLYKQEELRIMEGELLVTNMRDSKTEERRLALLSWKVDSRRIGRPGEKSLESDL